MSALPDSFFCAEGVIKLKLALPAGLGNISPSMSQKALRSLYQVSSGIRQDGPARVHLFVDKTPHRFRLGDVCVRI
jgi:hypothetical protein